MRLPAPLQAADLASSGPAFANAVLAGQLARASGASGASLGGTPKLAAPGQSQMATPSASLDKLQREDLLMHELDQARGVPSSLRSILSPALG